MCQCIPSEQLAVLYWRRTLQETVRVSKAQRQRVMVCRLAWTDTPRLCYAVLECSSLPSILSPAYVLATHIVDRGLIQAVMVHYGRVKSHIVGRNIHPRGDWEVSALLRRAGRSFCPQIMGLVSSSCLSTPILLMIPQSNCSCDCFWIVLLDCGCHCFQFARCNGDQDLTILPKTHHSFISFDPSICLRSSRRIRA